MAASLSRIYPRRSQSGKGHVYVTDHDLGEIYAGDTFVFDDVGKSDLTIESLSP